MNRKWMAAAAGVLVLAAGIVLGMHLEKPVIPATVPEPTPEQWVETVYEPTCETAGYTKRENAQTGVIEIQDGEPALGHSYGEWKPDTQTGGSVRVCTVCGAAQSQLPAKAIQLPEIRFEGSMDGISKETRIVLLANVKDELQPFQCYAYTSWQGHSTLANEKKNYTVRFFDDETLTRKHRLELRPGWQLEHKYVLKANYADVTQTRNLICADVWAQMAASRAGMNPRLANTSHYGATDGFPVTVWLNDEFYGLYTLNLHKDDDLYAMYEGWQDAVMICNGSGSQEAMFRAETAFADEQNGWEVEFCGTDDAAWAQDSFNRLIRFVMTADDETFCAQMHEYMDVDAGIDYLLFMYAMGLTQSAGKDLVMLSYENSPWIASVYDMETAFGLSPDGSSASSASAFLPEKKDGQWASGTDSLLWDRMLNAFETEIAARWQSLRQSVLTEAELTAKVQTAASQVPAEAMEMDLALYAARTPLASPVEQMTEYIQQRLPLLDQLFEGAQ